MADIPLGEREKTAGEREGERERERESSGSRDSTISRKPRANPFIKTGP